MGRRDVQHSWHPEERRMSTPPRVRGWFAAGWLRGAYAAAALALSSCAALNVGTFNVAYEHADWLLQRMASHYVDFDAGQKQALQAGFGNLHEWHRRQEL